MNWTSILDRFIPKAILDQNELTTRARILVAILLVNILICTSAIVPLTLLALNGIVAYNAIGFMSLPPLGYTMCLYLLHRSNSLIFPSSAFALAILTPVMLAAYFTGGYGVTPVLPLLLAVPVYMFLLLGLRFGLLWSLLVFLIYSAFFAAQYFDIDFPQIMGTGDHLVIEYVVWVVMSVTILVSLIVYEWINAKLSASLNEERNKFAFQARHDILTGLANRRLFHDRLEEAIARSMRNRKSAALVFIDIDNFKPINDQYGHPVGDQLLQKLSSAIRSIVRRNDTAARLGGDEFAVIAEQVTCLNDVQVVIKKLLDMLSAPIVINGLQLSVSASIGAVEINAHSNPEVLYHLADEAMYKAKIHRNTYHIDENSFLSTEQCADKLTVRNENGHDTSINSSQPLKG